MRLTFSMKEQDRLIKSDRNEYLPLGGTLYYSRGDN